MATIPVLIDPRSAYVGTSAIPELVLISGSNAPLTGYAFDASSREDLYFDLTALSYGSGNLTLVLKWYSRSGSTTGNVVLGARIAAITAGDTTSMEAKNWATAQTTTTAVNSNAKGPTSTSITISNLDSLVANDEVLLNIYRDAANGSDTMSGDAIFTSGYLTYSDT